MTENKIGALGIEHYNLLDTEKCDLESEDSQHPSDKGPFGDNGGKRVGTGHVFYPQFWR